ncbi:RNA polymerase factor sigma-54 [Rhodospirillum sp. A1_3_36]|uniref:RNA polymerase factor sigma-54 n=1 Tax=Rhodospirillum sp. A1_3_36 TaxID=3391666 RepID=UPI0039A75666
MVMAPRLDLRQTQSLVMTPQLQQAIKLLQLSNLELSAFVEQEMERNPLLERDERPEVPREKDRREERADSGDTQVMDARADGASDAPMDQDFNTAADDSGPADAWGGDDGAGFEAGSQWGSGGGGSFEDREGGLEGTLVQGLSLRDHLTDQINVDIPDQVGRVIAQYLMGLLDDAGYLSGTLEEAADALGCPVEQVAEVLTRLQSMDPPGLFARSLKECLALQLADRNRLDPAMQALLDNLELLAKRDMAALLKVCGVDGEDLSEMIGEIRALDPKPALRFDVGTSQPVVPDVLMRPDPQGGWIVELNGETLPRVLVNNRYMARLSKTGDKQTKAFVSESLATANWLVKSLDQRANTILKVAAEMVRRQDAFFVHGVSHLRPLILRDIAEAIEMHESTVSRVTSNKYISTPRGLYELKYFFTQAIAGSGGAESHSAESVRHRIKVLIDEEPPEKVLSDDRIVEILKSEGVDIARRTVAKYREGMKIPSSVRRRREKTAQLS